MKTSELFPLSRVNMSYAGYFLDKGGSIWSTKRTGSPQQLKKFAKYDYYSLFVNGRSLIMYSYEINKIMKSVEYISWQKSQPNITDHFNSQTYTSNKQYIVGSLRSGYFSFSSAPKIHTSESSAKTETERLARSNPGTTYVYLEVKGKCTVAGVQWS